MNEPSWFGSTPPADFMDRINQGLSPREPDEQENDGDDEPVNCLVAYCPAWPAPHMRITHQAFRYVPAVATNITESPAWRKAKAALANS